jgi:hypothetical protein
MGGKDVFHLTTREQLDTAVRHYAATGQDWLVSRDADNFTTDARRHQFRVVVLHDRVLRVCEHVQADPEAPCNESQGAVPPSSPWSSWRRSTAAWPSPRRNRWGCPSEGPILRSKTAA